MAKIACLRMTMQKMIAVQGELDRRRPLTSHCLTDPVVGISKFVKRDLSVSR
jgi:hypothetical protein